MASSYSAPVSVVQVGSYFVGQYYKVLQQQPDVVYQFYSDGSTIVRIDGDSEQTVSSIMDIHNIVTSQNFASIEVKTINSVESWHGGILVAVSGSVKIRGFSGWRKFVQTFFLAPQEKGFFVLNDIFQYVEEEVIYQHQLPMSSENKYDIQVNANSPHLEVPVSNYSLEEEAREYMNSVHIEDDPVDKFSIPEQQLQQEPEPEVVVEEAPVESSASMHSWGNTYQEPPVTLVESSWEEPQKKTYASILRVANAQSAPPVSSQQSFNNRSTSAPDWNHTLQIPAQQLNFGSSSVPEIGIEQVEGSYSVADEGEPRSVYVRNLPLAITAAEIEQEFKKFGKIIPDGVFIRQQKDVSSPYAYAFVEFEELSSVKAAIEASPVYLAGTQVYVEERRPNRNSSFRGGRRGRGRGNYQTDTSRGRFGGRGLGRGGSHDGGDYSSFRGNGPQRNLR